MSKKNDLIYEIAQEVSLSLKNNYDEYKNNTDAFNQGYLSGLSIAYNCFRNRLLTCEDIDEDKLKEIGVAEELWNVNIKDFYK